MCTQLQIPKGDYADKDDFEFIFVPFVTRKNGHRDYARNHGLKAWRIRVRKGHYSLGMDVGGSIHVLKSLLLRKD